MRRVVCDTGPVLHLHEAHALHLLSLTGDVAIPLAVESELTRLIPTWAEQSPASFERRMLDEAGRREADVWSEAGLLDSGESEAVALAREIGADWFLTDDTAARVVAERLGLEVHGSLGVVLWAAAVGHLERSEANQTLRDLFRSSLWVSPRVRSQALRALDAIF